MQKNPKEAMARYGANPEFQELLLEFSKIMGDHFDKLSKDSAKKEEQTVQNQPPRDKKAEVFHSQMLIIIVSRKY